MNPYRADFSLPGSATNLYEYLTDADKLVAWWPSGAFTDPRVGGLYHLWWDGPGWHLRGEYLATNPPYDLVFTWAWDHEELDPRRVALTLSDQLLTGCTLSIEHEAHSDEERVSYQEGWEHFIGQLTEVLERT